MYVQPHIILDYRRRRTEFVNSTERNITLDKEDQTKNINLYE